MKIDLKNPIFYYVTVPVLTALWAILAAGVFYPNSIKASKQFQDERENVEELIGELVALQPERLTVKRGENTEVEEFDFIKTVSKFAQHYSIASSDYNLTVKADTNRGGRKTRSASISIKTIDIEKMAKFVDQMLLHWPDLKCERLSFQKIKNTKNRWQVDISLTYYY